MTELKPNPLHHRIPDLDAIVPSLWCDSPLSDFDTTDYFGPSDATTTTNPAPPSSVDFPSLLQAEFDIKKLDPSPYHPIIIDTNAPPTTFASPLLAPSSPTYLCLSDDDTLSDSSLSSYAPSNPPSPTTPPSYSFQPDGFPGAAFGVGEFYEQVMYGMGGVGPAFKAHGGSVRVQDVMLSSVFVEHPHQQGVVVVEEEAAPAPQSQTQGVEEFLMSGVDIKLEDAEEEGVHAVTDVVLKVEESQSSPPSNPAIT
ncbi:hypothetical protein HK104_007907, partial [Borealophlyctis nickersoniae]